MYGSIKIKLAGRRNMMSSFLFVLKRGYLKNYLRTDDLASLKVMMRIWRKILILAK